MDSTQLLAPLVFTIISLAAGAFLKFVLKSTPIPYSVGLFAFGILIGLSDRIGLFTPIPILNSSIHFAGDMNPDLILYIFLPILIFDAAYELDAHIFRKTLTNATILSVPGVVIAMFLTGGILMGIEQLFPGQTGWNWTYALMFGALISATDPVAVVALLKELGVNKRFSTLVDAESMLNDGTGIVLFMLFFGVFTPGGAPSSPVADFIFVVAGGALSGIFIAALCIIFIAKVQGDAMIQNSIIIVAAYVTFFITQSYMNVSGVIALVGFGLTIAYYARTRLSPGVDRFMRKFWELATYIANTLIFIIVGVVIASKVHFTLLDVGILFAIYIGINLIRMFMVALFFPLMKRSGYGISKREAVILSWGGLRGALGLTLALIVSYTPSIPEPIRRQILFLTAGIVTLTLLINATTVRWLLKKLGLTRTSSAKEVLDYSVRKLLKENADKYLEVLQKKESLQTADWTVVENFLPPCKESPVPSVGQQEIIADIRLRILDKEKSLYWNLFSDGTISSETMRRLNYMADELYDQNGNQPLTSRGNILIFPLRSGILHQSKWLKSMQSWFEKYYLEKLISGYDLAQGFITTQKAALKLLEEFKSDEELPEEQKNALASIKQELNVNITEGEKYINAIAKNYPVSYQRAITHKAVRMLLSHEKNDIETLQRQGVIPPDDARVMTDNLGQRHNKVFH